MNITQIANLTRPGVHAITGDYNNYPSEYTQIYTTKPSHMATETDIEMRFLGLGQYRPEGAPTAVDDMGQRSITQYNHRYFALAFNITRMALVNNLYQSKFPNYLRALKKSMQQTKEVSAASILNNAANANFPMGDGQPLFSTAHRIDGGTYSNTTAANTDLSEAALENACIALSTWPDVAGLVTATKPMKVIVAPSNMFTIKRLLGSQYRPGVDTNDINVINDQNIFPKGYIINHYLTNPGFWGILTDAENGFTHFEREKFETDVYCDFSTDSLMVKAVECYSFGNSNPRSIYGNNGT